MAVVDPSAVAAPSRVRTGLGALAVAGMASLGAGAVHATAIGAHNEHPQAARVFVAVAALQLGWGAVALVRSSRWLAAAGVLLQSVLLGGWVVAKTAGLPVDGMEAAESVQTADALAAALAALSLVAALAVLATGRRDGPPSSVSATWGLLVAALTLPGMLSAGGHSHAGSHDHDVAATTPGAVATGTDDHHADGSTHADGSAHDDALAVVEAAPAAGPAVVAPKPYDPTQPIDLGGVPGVTPEQQARAENLIAVTLLRLPKFADPAVAEAAGYRSIGDGLTGHEHYINWSLINDDVVLDPDQPESLVYEVRPGQPKKLVSAMFMLPEGQTLDTVPDIGGPLTQWHIHDDLCFTDDPLAPRVAGVTAVGGSCRPPLRKLAPVPMIHVWITPHACGPFAALEGVGAGQVKPGEVQLCDHAHGA